MMRITLKIITCLFLLLYSLSVQAVGNNVQDDSPLVVGVFVSPPYVIHEKSGNYGGYAIEILHRSLFAAGITKKIVYKEYESIGMLIGDINNLDIAVSSISFTPDRLARMEFSQPLDEGGLGVMVKSTDETIAGRSIYIYISIGVGLLAAGVLLTIFDRRFIPGFTRDWIAGFSESMYHVVSITLRGNCVTHPPVMNKTLQNWLSILWMFLGSVFMSFVMVTYMGVMKHDPQFSSKENLFETRIGVIKGSSSELYIKEQDCVYLTYKNIAEAVDALVQDHVDAVIADRAELVYYEHKKKGLPVAVIDNFLLNTELYGYAYPLKSPLRLTIDKHILEYYTDGKIASIKNYYGMTK